MDEFERIDRLLKPLAEGLAGALGLTDDAGLLSPPPGQDLVVTTDTMVEGVHFLPGEPADRLARKLLRVNLSDLAAMAARPHAYCLTTAVPAGLGDTWLGRFADGLAEDQRRFGCRLLGGDSVSTPGALTVGVTAFGLVTAGRAVRRAGARAGDDVWVSGHLGGGVLGLMAARGQLDDLGLAPSTLSALAGRYHLPDPRVALGQALSGLSTAMLDVSDGLAGDLGHLCRASGLGAELQADDVPVSDATRAVLRARPDLLAPAIAGGDDYELLFTAGPADRDRILAAGRDTATPVSRIGHMTPGSGVRIRDKGGGEMAGLAGWRHF